MTAVTDKARLFSLLRRLESLYRDPEGRVLGVTSQVLAQEAGMPLDQCRKQLSRLVASGHAEKTGGSPATGGCFYRTVGAEPVDARGRHENHRNRYSAAVRGVRAAGPAPAVAAQRTQFYELQMRIAGVSIRRLARGR